MVNQRLPKGFDISNLDVATDHDQMEDEAHRAMTTVRYQILVPEFYAHAYCAQCGVVCRAGGEHKFCAQCAVKALALIVGTYAANEFGDACDRLKRMEELVLAHAAPRY